ncbi:MAG TPA: winged helix-turn-helix domain-containing protein [Pyrinomonadaceae bacterium]|nr:winged helix-turn-helix domain-containing protein [Pyrinomonadaceae bacterium]
MDRVNGAVFEFGEFHLDTAERVLRRDKKVVPLTPKAISLLELLVSREGSVVSRAEMIETLWPDTYVEEANLTVTISMVRKALGENYIRTIPKRGYTFAIPVTRIELPTTNGNHPTPAPIDLPRPAAEAVTPSGSGQRRLVFAVSLAIMLFVIAVWAGWGRFRRPTISKPPAPMRIARLTDTGNIRDVTLSPDGRWLAVVSIDGGLEGLKIKNLDTNEQHELVEAQEQLCWGLLFAHDGQSIYYNTTQPNSTISVLYRISARGGQAHKLVVNIDSPISLSPDGSQIAFVRSFPGRHYDALVVANNDGTGERELSVVKHPEKFSFSGSAWSPDGKTIALGVTPNNGVSYSIKGVPLAGGAVRELTPQQWTTVRGLAWSDDGRALIFSAGTKELPATQLRRLGTQSGAIEPVTNDANFYEGVHLTKNGGKLVTTQVAELINVWGVDPASGSAPRKLTFGTKEGEGGVITLPNGQVVYTLEQNRHLDLWAINPDGTGAVQLTQAGAGFPAVTADGKFLVYGSLRSGVRHLYRLDLATRQEVQLTNGGGENYPSISPDGRWVIYTSLSPARNTLWKVSIDGGTPQQITQGSIIFKPVISPDGQSIACAYRKDEADKWKIAILPIAGGEPRQIVDLPKPFNQIVRWTPDSQALFYVVEKKGVGNIWKHPLDGSPAEQITQFTEDQIYHYDRSADGNDLVLARGRIMRDIVLINNP